MNNTATQIANLITRNGKTGADMTHALKELGSGDMQKGLTRIAEFFLKDSVILTIQVLIWLKEALYRLSQL